MMIGGFVWGTVSDISGLDNFYFDYKMIYLQLIFIFSLFKHKQNNNNTNLKGRKYILFIALIFNSIFGVLSGLSQTFFYLLLFRFLSGIG